MADGAPSFSVVSGNAFLSSAAAAAAAPLTNFMWHQGSGRRRALLLRNSLKWLQCKRELGTWSARRELRSQPKSFQEGLRVEVAARCVGASWRQGRVVSGVVALRAFKKVWRRRVDIDTDLVAGIVAGAVVLVEGAFEKVWRRRHRHVDIDIGIVNGGVIALRAFEKVWRHVGVDRALQTIWRTHVAGCCHRGNCLADGFFSCGGLCSKISHSRCAS